jgi:hypothetical protein
VEWSTKPDKEARGGSALEEVDFLSQLTCFWDRGILWAPVGIGEWVDLVGCNWKIDKGFHGGIWFAAKGNAKVTGAF